MKAAACMADGKLSLEDAQDKGHTGNAQSTLRSKGRWEFAIKNLLEYAVLLKWSLKHKSIFSYILEIFSSLLHVSLSLFFFMATPAAYGRSWAMDWIPATVATYTESFNPLLEDRDGTQASPATQEAAVRFLIPTSQREILVHVFLTFSSLRDKNPPLFKFS